MDMAAQGQPGHTFHMLTKNGKPVAGIMSTDMAEMKAIPPRWSTFLGVDDVDARLKKCEDLGAKVIVPAMDLPEVGRMALIADNQGAQVWLFKPSM